MGFFRLRRSIKIFPGVRWNIGKKSTSFTFGGRGFHYTTGTRGRRTTIGLPGTGLSYTSTSSAAAASKRKWLADAVAWASKQHKSVHFEYPEREPGEADATLRQKQTILGLAQSIDGTVLESLGKKQASALITLIKEEKERFTNEKIQEYAAKSRSGGCGSIIGICFFGMIICGLVPSLFNPINNQPTPSTSRVTHPAMPRSVKPAAKVQSNSAPVANPPINRIVQSPTTGGAKANTTPMATPTNAKDDELLKHLPIKRYPDLAKANSRLSSEVRERYNRKKHTEPDFFNNPDWGTILAKESSEYIQSLSSGR